MPFLESLEYDDVLAIRGMNSMAYYGLLSGLLAHPMLHDGITDTQTTLVVVAASIAKAKGTPEEIRQTMAPGYADVESLSKGTKLSPHLKISIIRTGTRSQSWTTDTIWGSVELAERIMQLPLPTSHVIVVLNDAAVLDHSAGNNHGDNHGSYAIAYRPKYEDTKDSRNGQIFQSGIAHEVAHYYWRDMKDWLDEGIANTFEHLYGVETEIRPSLAQRKDCEAHNLEMLTDWDPQQGTPQYECNYYLGQMLFLELLDNMGVREFGEGLSELYLLSLAAKEADRTPGIAEVRQAFHGQSEIVEKHWSGKLNAPENRPWDEDLFYFSHNLIQWDQHPTYDGDTITFSGTLLGDAVLSSGTIGEANRDGYQNFHLYPVGSNEFGGNIYPPGWGHNMRHSGDTTALEYQLKGRTFTVKFRLPQKLGDPSGYFIDVWGFQDESRTPIIWPDRDRLGYARIQVE